MGYFKFKSRIYGFSTSCLDGGSWYFLREEGVMFSIPLLAILACISWLGWRRIWNGSLLVTSLTLDWKPLFWPSHTFLDFRYKPSILYLYTLWVIMSWAKKLNWCTIVLGYLKSQVSFDRCSSNFIFTFRRISLSLFFKRFTSLWPHVTVPSTRLQEPKMVTWINWYKGCGGRGWEGESKA